MMNLSLQVFLLLALATACMGAVRRDVRKKRSMTNDFFGIDGKITPEKMQAFKESIKANKDRWQETASKADKKPSKGDTTGQVYGGSEGTENMPWMAYIVTVNADNETVHECSGFIMNETKIVTAAQCLERGNMSYVTVGNIDRTSADAVTIKVPYTQWLVPKEFVMNGLESDIAVLNISATPLTLGAKIAALPLPSASMYKQKGFTMDSKPITINGFGHAESGDEDCPAPDGPAMIFNMAQTMTGNSTKYCKSQYKAIYTYMAKTHGCTTAIFNATTPGSCDADKGGPVLYMPAGAASPVPIGVIGYNDACQNKNPVLYTDVNKMMKFLTKALNMKQPK